MKDLRVGDALAIDTQVDPVASEKQLLNNLGFVNLARN